MIVYLDLLNSDSLTQCSLPVCEVIVLNLSKAFIMWGYVYIYACFFNILACDMKNPLHSVFAHHTSTSPLVREEMTTLNEVPETSKK